MKILYNPENVIIKNFVHNKVRVMLVPQESAEYPDDVAEAAVKTLPFLVIKEGEKEYMEKPVIEKPKGTSMKGMAGLGETSIQKLKEGNILCREDLFTELDKDPIYVKKLIGGPVYSKLVDSGIARNVDANGNEIVKKIVKKDDKINIL